MKEGNQGTTRKYIGLVGAVGALVAIYFASGSPIPLYAMYQEQLGLTHAQLSMTSMWYLIGTVFPLLFLPRLSDHLGRRPVTILILCLAISGCCIYIGMASPKMLMFARLLQGVVSGLGSSTVAAYVVDLCVGLPKWVGPAITSSAPTLGLSSGAFISGGLIRYTEMDPPVLFTTVAVLMVVLIILVAIGAETMQRKKGLVGSLKPRIQVPKSARHMFVASAVLFIGTWAIGGFYQAFSATIVTEHFGYQDSFIAAAVFTAVLLPNAVGGFFANRFETRTAQRMGMGGFAFGMVMATICLANDNLLLMCLFSIFSGFMQGIGFTGSVTGIMSRATQSERAGTFSTIYLTSYGGAAVPNLVVGIVAGDSSSLDIMIWYTILTVVMFGLLMVLTVKKYEDVPATDVPISD